jgi:hypothetical protein
MASFRSGLSVKVAAARHQFIEPVIIDELERLLPIMALAG